MRSDRAEADCLSNSLTASQTELEKPTAIARSLAGAGLNLILQVRPGSINAPVSGCR